MVVFLVAGGRPTAIQRDWATLEACKSAASAIIAKAQLTRSSGASYLCLDAKTGAEIAGTPMHRIDPSP